MNEYKLLKELLVGDEVEQLSKLEEHIHALFHKTTDPDEIIDSISKHLDKIVVKNIELDKQALAHALLPIVSDAVEKEIEISSARIARKLLPLIPKALKRHIKEDRAELVDVLYPIMGDLLKKYAASTAKEYYGVVNEKMQNNLTLNGIKRKVRAHKEGISEAKLILDETLTWNIKSIFLIKKDSGLLIAHTHTNEDGFRESEMVASMLTAIRNFVNDWITQNKDIGELHEIEYGGSSIYIETSAHCYLAIVLKGTHSKDLLFFIHKTLSEIIDNIGDEIEEFNGDHTKIDTGYINRELNAILNYKPSRKGDSHFPLIFISALLLTLFTYLSYSAYSEYFYNDQIKKINNHFVHDADLALYNIYASKAEGGIVLKGGVLSDEFKNKAFKIASGNVPSSMKITNDIIVSPKDFFSDVQKSIKRLDAETADIRKVLMQGIQPISTSNPSLKENNQSRPKPVVELKIEPFNIYFKHGSTDIRRDEYSKLIKVKRALQENPAYKLNIYGYSDTSGSKDGNLFISKERARSVRRELMDMGVNKRKFNEVKGLGVPPPDFDAEHDKAKDARVAIINIESFKE